MAPATLLVVILFIPFLQETNTFVVTDVMKINLYTSITLAWMIVSYLTNIDDNGTETFVTILAHIGGISIGTVLV